MKRIFAGVSIALLVAFSSTTYAWDHDHDGKPLGPLIWVDKNGKTIGRAVGEGSVQVVVDKLNLIVPVAGKLVCSSTGCTRSLAVTWGGNSSNGVSGVFFSQPNCRGDAWVSFFAPGSERAVGVVGRTLYIGSGDPPSSKAPLSVPYQSILAEDGTCTNALPPPTPPQTIFFYVWPVVKTVTLKYTPPFTLR
jgi:hypothetical protein